MNSLSTGYTFVLMLMALNLCSHVTTVCGFPSQTQDEGTDYSSNYDDDVRDAVAASEFARTLENSFLDLTSSAHNFAEPSQQQRPAIRKRHACEFHSVCEQCAKHTKSHEVYSQCCRNADGRKWCIDFLSYEMGKK